MMSMEALVEKYELLGVRLYCEDGKLKFKAPSGILTNERKAELVAHKEELIEYLSKAADIKLTCDKENRYNAFPLSDIQTAYLMGRNTAYEYGGVGCHAYIELTMPPMDKNRLEKAWHKVIERHDMLRAVVYAEGYQKVQEEVTLPPLRENDLRGCNENQKEEAILKIRDELSAKQYKPDVWPLYDLVLTSFDDKSIIHLSIDMLISDFVSANILLKELDYFYYENVEEIKPLEVTYRDILLYEQAVKNSPTEKMKMEKDKKYWMNRIEKMPEGPQLPIKNSDLCHNEKVIFDQYKLSLSSEKWKKICDIAKENRITPSSVILAAYSEVIKLWSKKSDFCINLTLLNRPDVHEEINKVIGDFTVVDVFEINGREKNTFTDKVKKVQERLWSDLEHMSFSGVEVLREMRRLKNKNVIMPVVYTSTIGVGNDNAIDGNFMRNASLTYKISQTPQVWIDCQVTEEKGMLCVNWDVRRGIFKDHVIEDAFECFNTLINDLCNKSTWESTSCVSLPDCVKEMREKVNATAGVIPEDLMQDKFFEHLNNSPDHKALVCVEGEFTYKELSEYACAIQKELINNKVNECDIVGIVLQKGVWQIASTLGILSTGCTYVPIDATQPVSRQNIILEDANIKCIITDGNAPTEEYIESVSIINVDNLKVDNNDKLKNIKTNPDNPAYVIYTSGSTGKPKGVVISHKGALNTIYDINSKFNVTSEDSILGLANLAFDLSVYDVFGMFNAGGTLILPDPNHLKEPGHWDSLLRKNKVTLWNSVPAQMEMLVSCLKSSNCEKNNNLRVALLSGDWIPTGLPKDMKSVFPEIQPISLGGATEASIWSIYYPIDTEKKYEGSIPYGTPLTNQKFYVLNDNLEPCQNWIDGNLYIGGVGLALEYLNNEKLTNASFIIHPQTKERLYYTGDLGRYRNDGVIEFLGREDTQVKIHGHRIELSEIENVLQKHPLVSNAVTIISGKNSEEYKLAAFVQPQKTAVQKYNEYDAEMKEVCTVCGDSVTADIDRNLFKDWMDKANKTTLCDIMRTLFNAGLFENCEVSHSADEVQKALKAAPQYSQLVRRWLKALCAENYLVFDGKYKLASECIKDFDMDKCWKDWDEAEEKLKYGNKLMSYFKESSENLPKLLTGEVDPLDLLFPQGNLDIVMSAYKDNLINKCMNEIVKESVLFMAKKYKKLNKTLRILEVGAGAGGTTAQVIPYLKDYNVEYYFTDISTFFLNKARESFEDYKFMTYGLYDLNKEYWKQNIKASSYDIIICANVLHDAYDVPKALKNLKKIAVPGGKLIAIDAIHEAYSLLTSLEFKGGLTGFVDSRCGKDQVFFEREEWEEMFKDCNLNTVYSYPAKEDLLDLGSQGVFVMRFESEEENISEEEVREFAKNNLPTYMVPSSIEIMSELPLTNNGKINRKLLKERVKNVETAAVSQGEEPKNDFEKRIAKIWAQVLKKDVVWRNDNFYEIGGDSLLVAQVVAKMKESLEEVHDLEWDRIMLEIMRNPSVKEIAAALSKIESKEDKKNEEELPYVILADGKENSKCMKVIIADATGFLTPYNFILPQLINDPNRTEPIIGFSHESSDLHQKISFERYIEKLAQEYAITLEKTGYKEFELIGYCVGGLVALEAAKALLEYGFDVKRIVTIDTGINQPILNSDLLMERAFAIGVGADLTKIGQYVDNDTLREGLESLKAAGKDFSTEAICSLPGEAGECYTKLAKVPRDERLKQIFSTALSLNKERNSYTIEEIKDIYKFFYNSFRAVQTYEPKVFMGNVLALRCKEKSTGFLPITKLKSETFWEEYTLGELELKNIDGNHMTCLKPPYAEELGKIIIGGSKNEK